ncbi:hypothetical protein J6590_049867 [Homalodisca vitripennis]|nr:hypothetical protein J6590_049867 [Homalodisca vitripennis]
MQFELARSWASHIPVATVAVAAGTLRCPLLHSWPPISGVWDAKVRRDVTTTASEFHLSAITTHDLTVRQHNLRDTVPLQIGPII